MARKQSNLWSINAGTYFGIPVRIHLTFFILLLWIASDGVSEKAGPLGEVLFVGSIFLCVLLHEFGHALTARRFGIKTRDIVLFPFGGIATIVGQPKPEGEFFIAIAGPLVNVVIALLILPFLNLLEFIEGPGFLGRLFIANILLVIFNLIPALPMDGGRILRASLALLNFKHATLVAARIGQALSILMGLAALAFGRIDLLLISVLVFLGAIQEYVQEQARTAVVGFTVKDAMIAAPHLQTFTHGITVSSALAAALRSFQSIFPVVYGSEVLGVIDRNSLIDALGQGASREYVSGLMLREFPKISSSEPLARGLELAEGSGGAPVVVVDDKEFVGLLVPEKALELLLVQGMQERVKTEEPPDDFPF